MRTIKEKRNCFILAPIGKAGSEIRSRSDQMLKFLYEPTLKKFNYRAIRADKIPKAGLITSQIIQLITDSPLVIADLTGGNPNVFYELGIRHVTRKPYIQLIQRGEPLPFDIHGIRTIEIDHKDLDSIEQAKKEIADQIVEFEKGHIPDSPVTIASTVTAIQKSAESAEGFVRAINELRENFSYQSQEMRTLNLQMRAMEREFSSLISGLMQRYTGGG